jgi:hypothetical protein
MGRKRRSRLPGFIVLVVVCGCGGDDISSRDGFDDRQVFQPDFTIGLADGDPDYLFGDVRTVAVDGEGRVYVGDRIGANIRAYDGDASFIKRIAREGRGPGEMARAKWSRSAKGSPRSKSATRSRAPFS